MLVVNVGEDISRLQPYLSLSVATARREFHHVDRRFCLNRRFMTNTAENSMAKDQHRDSRAVADVETSSSLSSGV